jgi:hypothetical protein
VWAGRVMRRQGCPLIPLTAEVLGIVWCLPLLGSTLLCLQPGVLQPLGCPAHAGRLGTCVHGAYERGLFPPASCGPRLLSVLLEGAGHQGMPWGPLVQVKHVH